MRCTKGIVAYRRAAGGGFDPTSITDLALWLDADDNTTITDSGGIVSQWDDKSGDGNHVNSAAGTVTTGVNTMNGKNVLAFNAAGRLRRSTTPFGIATGWITVFVVCKKTGSAATFEAFPIVFTNGTSSGHSMDGWSNTGTMRFGAGPWINSATVGTYTDIAVQTMPTQLTVLVSGAAGLTNFSQRRNGVLAGNGSAAASAWSPQFTDIGGRGDGATTFEGDIAEILVYDRELTSGEIEDVETYLIGKWGIT